jgi:DNA polymerase elongation subunit (family B)
MFWISILFYQDPRVAELITAFGQSTLKYLENFAGKENVLYGDTDSIYLKSENDAIISEAYQSCGAKLEVDKRCKILFLTPNKKQYFGITEDGELIHTRLTGMKSNQPSYFDKVARRLISKEFIESFIPGNGSCNCSGSSSSSRGNPLDAVIDYVRSAFTQLDNIDKDELSYSQSPDKELYDYENNVIQRQIYNEILEDSGSVELAQLKSQAKCVYKYWKILTEGRSVTTHPERYQLNLVKYKEVLFTCVKPILEAYTYGVRTPVAAVADRDIKKR